MDPELLGPTINPFNSKGWWSNGKGSGGRWRGLVWGVGRSGDGGNPALVGERWVATGDWRLARPHLTQAGLKGSVKSIT